jgi:hypothetical protein
MIHPQIKPEPSRRMPANKFGMILYIAGRTEVALLKEIGGKTKERRNRHHI